MAPGFVEQPIIIVLGIGAVLVLFWLLTTFNGLVRLRNHCRESWSGIDTELKRRYDLIPNLIETVKGYAKHEREVLERVTEARNKAAASNGSPATQAKDENLLVQNLRGLFAVAENYPDLKANTSFVELQRELANTEDRIQAARRFYNANVRDYNTRIETIPSNLVAAMGGFQKQEFFEIENAIERTVPKVSFS